MSIQDTLLYINTTTLQLGNLMALLLAWVYTFDFLARELEDLELQAGQTSRTLQMAELGGQGVPQGYDPEAPPEQRAAMEAGYAAAPVGLADAPAPGAYAVGTCGGTWLPVQKVVDTLSSY